MVFQRRNRLPFLARVGSLVYPKGGWMRAGSYIWHRLRRLPDAPHRIARGVFAGILVSFTPLFGFHFLLAALVGYVIRANIFAALLATFIGNPLTFPFIAGSALAMGEWIFGHAGEFSFPELTAAFSRAGAELWHNARSAFSGEPAHWSNLARFYDRVFLPYLVGGILPGIATGLVGYYVTIPLVSAYQKRRKKRLRERFLRIREQLAERAAAEAGPAVRAGTAAAEVAIPGPRPTPPPE